MRPVDNDCSDGDTLTEVAAEDADDDGHAPPDAACTGGFPKDDCEDDHELVFPGVRPFFDRPWCPRRYGTDLFYRPGFGWICGTEEVLPSFDYDCSGSVELQARHVSCRTPAGDAVCLPDGSVACLGDGPTEDVTVSQCGRPVAYARCDCVPDSAVPSGARCQSTAETADLPCR